MIALEKVSDEPRLLGGRPCLAHEVDLDIPTGHYALLSRDPALKKPAVDLLAGLRPPERGKVHIVGLPSWPIGRAGFVRGKMRGRHVVALVARLYGLEVSLANAIVETLLTDPGPIEDRLDQWTPDFRREFGMAVALLPPFDVFVMESAFPFLKDRFTYLWKALFEERIEGKMLIVASPRVTDLTEYCDRAIVLDGGRIVVAHDLKEALEQYPPRPAVSWALEGGGESVAIADGLI